MGAPGADRDVDVVADTPHDAARPAAGDPVAGDPPAARADDPLVPSAGARFVLERRAVDAAGDGAAYDGRIVTPTADFRFAVALVAGGEPVLRALDGADGPAPADLVDGLAMFARLTARGVPRRREDGLPPWPSRVTRWRGPGRGG